MLNKLEAGRCRVCIHTLRKFKKLNLNSKLIIKVLCQHFMTSGTSNMYLCLDISIVQKEILSSPQEFVPNANIDLPRNRRLIDVLEVTKWTLKLKHKNFLSSNLQANCPKRHVYFFYQGQGCNDSLNSLS